MSKHPTAPQSGWWRAEESTITFECHICNRQIEACVASIHLNTCWHDEDSRKLPINTDLWQYPITDGRWATKYRVVWTMSHYSEHVHPNAQTLPFHNHFRDMMQTFESAIYRKEPNFKYAALPMSNWTANRVNVFDQAGEDLLKRLYRKWRLARTDNDLRALWYDFGVLHAYLRLFKLKLGFVHRLADIEAAHIENDWTLGEALRHTEVLECVKRVFPIYGNVPIFAMKAGYNYGSSLWLGARRPRAIPLTQYDRRNNAPPPIQQSDSSNIETSSQPTVLNPVNPSELDSDYDGMSDIE